MGQKEDEEFKLGETHLGMCWNYPREGKTKRAKNCCGGRARSKRNTGTEEENAARYHFTHVYFGVSFFYLLAVICFIVIISLPNG